MARELRLAARLREWGLRVVEDAGWQSRGSTSFAPRGVVLHHTAGASAGDMPSLRVLREGRSDLPGPLAQIGLGRSGTVYVVAAGRANHAGAGGWHGLSGNSTVFGIEAENDGRQPWPAVQLEAMWRAAAALLTLTPSRDPELVALHREWAPGRKTDPHSIAGAAARARIADQLLVGPDSRRTERPAPPPPPPPHHQEDAMILIRARGSEPVYLVEGGHRIWLPNPQQLLELAGDDAWSKVRDVAPDHVLMRLPEWTPPA